MSSLVLEHSFCVVPPDLRYIVIGVGAAAGRGLSGAANLGDYGADDPWRSQEPPALSAQRGKQLFVFHTQSDGVNCHAHSPFFLSHTHMHTSTHTASTPHFVMLICNHSPVVCNSVFWCSLPSHYIPSYSAIEFHQPGPSPAQKDDPDGRRNRRRHVIPKCQQICPQRSGCQKLHGG